MDMNDYQKKALTFANYSSAWVDDPPSLVAPTQIECGWMYPALALAEEAGECAGKCAKILRDKRGEVSAEDVAAIKKELGDVMWQVSALAYEFGLDLDEVAEANIKKLEDRKARGVLGGSGDNR